MSVLVKIGERTYEVVDEPTASRCREIYVSHTGDQNSLEEKFEKCGIDFYIENFLAYQPSVEKVE